MNKSFVPAQTVYIVGKPGIEFGKPVTFMKTLPGLGHVVNAGPMMLLVEPEYLTSKVLDVAA